jgi:AcrR family transcriptional regulator
MQDRSPGDRRAATQPREKQASKRRTQEARSTETRRKLVKAAVQVLAESGYANLTISKVSQRAGLTNGAMQHHFPSRDDLMMALMEAVYPVLEIPFRSIASERLDARERVARVVDLLWDIYRRPEYLAIWDIALGSRGDRKLWTRLRAFQQGVAIGMRAEFVALFADLALPADDVEQIFSLTISSIRGAALQAIFGPDPSRHHILTLAKEAAYDQLTKRAKPA